MSKLKKLKKQISNKILKIRIWIIKKLIPNDYIFMTEEEYESDLFHAGFQY